MNGLTLITGGAGCLGAPVAHELLAKGGRVRVLDTLIHGQQEVAADLARRGVEVVRGDLRDELARAAALVDVAAVVHLAAVVGDRACAGDPELAREVNVEASRALIDEGRRAGAKRFVFASTCSSYGRTADSTPVDERDEPRPASLYAEQKVEIERLLLDDEPHSMSPTPLRFAEIYGAAPRMRFDLTVNGLTRDLWGDREVEVLGERCWRPYVHVRDAARAVRIVLEAPAERVSGQVFNVGRSDENYRAADLVAAIGARVGRGRVKYLHDDEDQHGYKVSFDKVRAALDFEPWMTVPDGVTELAAALDARAFGDPYDGRYGNTD